MPNTNPTPISIAEITLDTGIGLGRIWIHDQFGTSALLFEGTPQEADDIYRALHEMIRLFKARRL